MMFIDTCIRTGDAWDLHPQSVSECSQCARSYTTCASRGKFDIQAEWLKARAMMKSGNKTTGPMQLPHAMQSELLGQFRLISDRASDVSGGRICLTQNAYAEI